ncbi:MAG TPA: hypothetical protein RMF84_12100, partial [Polyangiaceae bacterium LLY-WYZ-14_1]|nr:hypothetical protein [Polyangiaceae bacterium LLY-WYZ-14_1]
MSQGRGLVVLLKVASIPRRVPASRARWLLLAVTAGLSLGCEGTIDDSVAPGTDPPGRDPAGPGAR